MKIDKGLMSGSTELLILSLLQEQDKYGYQIINDLAVISNKVFELKEGTLYPILHSLEKKGALRSYVKTAPSGKDRKYYAITAIGKKSFEEKRENWNLFSLAVNKIVFNS